MLLRSIRHNNWKILLVLATGIGFCKASTGIIPFPVIEKAAQSIPTMREYHKRGELSVADYGFRNPNFYRASRMITIEALDAALDSFFEMMQTRLKNPELWRGKTLKLTSHLDPTDRLFTPYAQKLTLQEKDVFLCKGDLHGDVHSLIACIRQLQDFGYTSEENPYKIIDPNFYLIFLGDYTDRGLWGCEVMYLLLQLATHNPGQVFLVRGNHEDIQITQTFGFQKEFINKFKDAGEKGLGVVQKIAKFYEFLPVVLYVGASSSSKGSSLDGKAFSPGRAERIKRRSPQARIIKNNDRCGNRCWKRL